MTKKNPTTVGHHLGGKLQRTLNELESALSDWEAVSKNAPAKEIGDPVKPAATPPPEIIEKTKLLLEQLRDQIKELSD
jgi:hypothetical protein